MGNSGEWPWVLAAALAGRLCVHCGQCGTHQEGPWTREEPVFSNVRMQVSVRNRAEWETRAISKETVHKLRPPTRRSRAVGPGTFAASRT